MSFYQPRKQIPPSISTCLMCPMRPECIRCSALAMVDSKHPEKIRELVTRMIYRTAPSPEDQARMDEGTAAHKILVKARNVDLDPASVIGRIRRREEFCFALAFCSVRYGLRGSVDMVKLTTVAQPRGPKLVLTVVDDKTHFSSGYLKQLWGYALIITDPNCLYTNVMESESQEVERRHFYDDIGFGLHTDAPVYDEVEVWCGLNIYKRSKAKTAEASLRGAQVIDGVVNEPEPPKGFSRGNLPLEKYQYYAVIKAKKQILEKYHEPQLLAQASQTKFHGRTAEMYLPKSEVRK